MKPKLVIHTCCAVCMCYPKTLFENENYETIFYFYNPNIYPDEETTGLHSGWDITGTDTGAAAVTDRVTGNIPEEEPEGTDDVPDTMEDIPGAGENNEENAENDGVNAEEAGTTSDNSE